MEEEEDCTLERDVHEQLAVMETEIKWLKKLVTILLVIQLSQFGIQIPMLL